MHLQTMWADVTGGCPASQGGLPSAAGTSRRGLGAAGHCSGAPHCCASELLHSQERDREAAGLRWGDPVVTGRAAGARRRGVLGEELRRASLSLSGGQAAGAMEGCCTMAISLELSSLFPTLLQLSTKGKGFGNSFPRGRTGAGLWKKLQLPGCGGDWTGLGAAARALPGGPTGLGGRCGNQVLVLPGAPRLPWEWLRPLVRGAMQGQLSLEAGPSWGSGSGMKRASVSRGLGGTATPPTRLSRAGWKCLCCKSALSLEQSLLWENLSSSPWDPLVPPGWQITSWALGCQGFLGVRWPQPRS